MIYLLLFIIFILLLIISYIKIEKFTGITTSNEIFKDTYPIKYLGMGVCIKNNSFGYRSKDKCITINDLKKAQEKKKVKSKKCKKSKTNIKS